ncbi:MAG: neuraminidase-like domain-containing protein [Verrucomicrobiota bacterium]
MKKIIPPIRYGDQDQVVGNLQEALIALGFPINHDRELSEKSYGSYTSRAVRLFQTRYQLSEPDAGQVDQITADKINELLNEKGLLEDEKLYSVSGYLYNSRGRPIPGVTVNAYDVDLKGVRVYKSLKTQIELDESDGFERLGQTQTDQTGFYSISFTDTSYREAERRLADVIVYAIEGQRTDSGAQQGIILGHSEIARPENYTADGKIENHHMILSLSGYRESSEYEQLLNRANSFLEESGLALSDLRQSDEQILFLAQEVDWPLEQVSLLVQSTAFERYFEGTQNDYFYGLGRQSIPLNIFSLASQTKETLKEALTESMKINIISFRSDEEIEVFIEKVIEKLSLEMLQTKPDENAFALGEYLDIALPGESETQQALYQAYVSHEGSPETFWNEVLPRHPLFIDRRESIAKLQMTNELMMLTGDHLPLIRAVLTERHISASEELVTWSQEDWRALIDRSGMPQSIPGATLEEQKENYRQSITQQLEATYPTAKVAHMVQTEALHLDDPQVRPALNSFFQKADDFDLRHSRVHDFESQINEAGDEQSEVLSEQLKKIQRTFQLSPSSEIMQKLMQSGITSAQQVIEMPKGTFIKSYQTELGQDEAHAVYARASHMASQNLLIKTTLYEATSVHPQSVTPQTSLPQMLQLIGKYIPNYEELFGEATLCECKHCQSVYSPAAYLVDLLQFLERTGKNDLNESPLKLLLKRRPDLAHLPLTCENTHGVLPLVDLANEIMEYYLVNGTLDADTANDTGKVPTGVLQATPQYILPKAYEILAQEAIYPFKLPYHQPLDTIRTYLEHLDSSYFEVMDTFRTSQATSMSLELATEYLRLSTRIRSIITNQAPNLNLQLYYGYDPQNLNWKNQLIQVPELLSRSGIAYSDLVALLETRFLNPHQYTLTYLENILSDSSLSSADFYDKLKDVESGNLEPENDPTLKSLLDLKNIPYVGFKEWVMNHLSGFEKVLTLYEPDSKCDLESTKIRSLLFLYEPTDPNAEVPDLFFLRLHSFIRLWQKLDWSIQELDLALQVLPGSEIDDAMIQQIAELDCLKSRLKLPLDQLLCFWGPINTHGSDALYRSLFLNPDLQEIDPVFEADAMGNFLDPVNLIKDHEAVVRAAFRVSADNFSAIMQFENLDPVEASLSLQNLSQIYRNILLAKALKLEISELLLAKQMIPVNPFSEWDQNQQAFASISPASTQTFVQALEQIKQSNFSLHDLAYHFDLKTNVDGQALTQESVFSAVLSIRNGLLKVQADHPDLDMIDPETLKLKLGLLFEASAVSRIISLLDHNSIFSAIAPTNLALNINPLDISLSNKFDYDAANGTVTFSGIMITAERDALLALNNDLGYQAAITSLYVQPEEFITEDLHGIFSNAPFAIEKLLNRPEQQQPLSQEERYLFFFDALLPFLRGRLEQEVIISTLASILLLDEATTQLLIEKYIPDPMLLLQGGLSGKYYNNANFADPSAYEQVDPMVSFQWEEGPNSLPMDNFSISWEGWIQAFQGEIPTFVVTINGNDEAVSLWLNDELILERSSNNSSQALKLEGIASFPLEPTRLYPIRLKYVDFSGPAEIHLAWKTPTQASEIIDSDYLYSQSVVQLFSQQFTNLSKAAHLIRTWKLSPEEVAHLLKYSDEFAQLDFSNMTWDAWQRVQQYISLKLQSSVSVEAYLRLFNLAYSTSTDLLKIQSYLEEQFNWDSSTLSALFAHFGLSVLDFKNEQALIRLSNCLELINRMEIESSRLIDWSVPEDDYSKLHGRAQEIKYCVKAHYDESSWLKIAPSLNDSLRENQKQALICYLIIQPDLKDWGVRNADSLFDYFLIDVQMTPCMDTSRIKQAISSVQLFTQRCLLNLESELNQSSQEIGVAPGFIDVDHWEWMKNYRVWEANRKVFLYPQNWLEPEWRTDKSPFFKELESELLQNDITEENIENAFRNYLYSLDEVARLEVCGLYEDPANQIVHTFGRTSTIPYNFFYRKYYKKYQRWSAWEKVSADIQTTGLGEESGVYLVPVVWRERLYLFWPVFNEKTEPVDTGSKSFSQLADTSVKDNQARKNYEIQIAYSEYRDHDWTPKVISESYKVNIASPYASKIPSKKWPVIDISKVFIQSKIDEESQALSLHFTFSIGYLNTRYEKTIKATLNNKHDQFDFSNGMSAAEATELYLFNRVFKNSAKLILNNNNILNKSKRFNLSISNGFTNSFSPGATYYQDFYQTNSALPFYPKSSFYQEGRNVYFAESLNNYAGILFEVAKNFKSRRALQPSSSIKFENDLIKQPIDLGINGYSLSKPANKFILEKAFVTPPLTFKFSNALKFSVFYHPFVGDLIERLNQYGISKLLAGDTELPDDQGTIFKNRYSPDLSRVGGGYPRENIDFSRQGAYSLYNWELFYHAVMLVATTQSKNYKFAEADKWFKYIFDYTTNETPFFLNPYGRYWKLPIFRNAPEFDLEDFFKSLSPNQSSTQITEWRDNPFQPFLIANHRVRAYMENAFCKTCENLIAWGDHLFRRDTMESINEATQLYILAAHLLGPKPKIIPRRGSIKAETYDSLKPKLDAFSNAQVELENLFPYSSSVSSSNNTATETLLGSSSALYFCIPPNEKVFSYWDTVADRLFKIRHCMNIEGVERQLALFEPPIDPALLVQATAQGLSIGSVLGDLHSPMPHYRFTFIVRRAFEICQEVKSLGSTMLSALEKRDAEELARMRAEHELAMNDLVLLVKEEQIQEAFKNAESLRKAWDTTVSEFKHFQELLGLETLQDPQLEETTIKLKNGDEIAITNSDISITPIAVDVDVSLVDSSKSGVKIIPSEKEELDKMLDSKEDRKKASWLDKTANASYYVPEFETNIKPFGTGSSLVIGGQHVGSAFSAIAQHYHMLADIDTYEASKSKILAGYVRREQNWTYQANQAGLRLKELASQIASADIRLHLTQQELVNHKKRIQQNQEAFDFVKDKFTNQELYLWMKDQLFNVYKQTYQLAYETAKRAERTYRFDLGEESSNFIQYGHWESSKEGLLAGERLLLALNRMQNSYLDKNKRDLEVTKHISLRQLDPMALMELKATGSCKLQIPEYLFDLDFPGHYFRRIKTVSLSIPCVVGPYTSVSAQLTLTGNRIRKNGNATQNYSYQGVNDPNFIHDWVGLQSIATSSAQQDNGLFEFNFQDERYLPFEGAGAISEWQLSLPAELRQFDYASISDVIMHMSYTSRQGGQALGQSATQHIKDAVIGANTNRQTQLFSLKQNFSTEWHRAVAGKTNFKANIRKTHFPYLAQAFRVEVEQIDVWGSDGETLTPYNGFVIKPANLQNDFNDPLNESNPSSNQEVLTAELELDLSNLATEQEIFILMNYALV